MSEPWKEKLRERFRALGLDRLRAIGKALNEEGEERRTWLLGELHTLKGEAKMLGMGGITRLAHAVEARLGEADGRSPRAREAALSALEVATQALREGAGDDAVSEAALDVAIARLTAKEAGAEAEAEAVTGAEAGAEAGAGTGAEAGAGVGAGAEAEAATGADARERSSMTAPPNRSAYRWLRVPAAHVEELCDAVAELSTDFRLLASTLQRSVAPTQSAVQSQALREACDRCLSQLGTITSTAWAFRMVPIEPALEDLCRHAEELARSQGKRLQTVARAGGAAIDRDLLDALWDPLLHLIRNAVDHGIEAAGERASKAASATLTLDAEQAGGDIVLSIEDDGGGIDPVKVYAAAAKRGLLGEGERGRGASAFDLLFLPGFSTRGTVSDISGRGIGLSVVRQRVEALGGSIAVASEVGRGTRFSLRVPATLSKQRLLVFACGGDLYAVPARDALEVVRAPRDPARMDAGGDVVVWRQERLSVMSAGAALGAGAREAEPLVVVLKAPGGHVAVRVPSVLGEVELIRRPVDALIASREVVTGSATLDDGRLVLVLSVAGMLRLAEGASAEGPVAAPRPVEGRVLLVDDSPIVRRLLEGALMAAGLAVDTASDGPTALARIERAHPSAVVADVQMPEMDGFELTRRARRIAPGLPIVLFTVRESPEGRAEATAAGADAYLAKSGGDTGAELIETVRRLARGSR